MAEIIDAEQPELELQEGETAGNIEEDTPQIEEPVENAVEEEKVAEDEDTPEIYQGKSASELSKILLEKERQIGQQGNELHNLRSTLDAMALNTSKASEPEPEPITEADFFSDPTNTVNRAIESHPALRQAQEMAQKMVYAQGLATLQRRHPDLKEVMASPKFDEWIKSSSVRSARYQRADLTGDVEEADDLISTFKQLNQIEATTKQASAKAQKQAVKSANTGSTRGNSDVRGSRRVYRRADIRELMKTNPKRYEDLQPEIMQAYAEGRVRD
jgi:hypothetical protein